ncbi:5' nucleotidase, NT5C type [Oribacterium sp. FC2011]|uniref:5' nucleotidase, NT5C type n=1 Tax=Oribacterium sp. FC2011 TaxID=1408311 RepID=UPI0004E0CFB5|nr:hypothetical protein [Oribacterium sp. FC2011]
MAESNNYKIFFDMDGVLADFNKGVIDLCGVSPQDQETADEEATDNLWTAVRNVDHFYDRLEPVVGAIEMFEYAYKITNGNCEILTGIPKPKRNIPDAGDDKIKWVHRLLGENVKVNIVYKEEKKNFCEGKNSILVDDLSPNINEWENAGGTGILFKNPKETIEKINEIMGIIN